MKQITKLLAALSLITLFALVQQPAFGAGAVVQNCEASATAGATSVACALGVAPTAGNTIVVFINFAGGTESGVTITNGTDAEAIAGTVVNDGGTRSAMYQKRGITGGGSTTFTWSNATSLTNRSIWVAELSGIHTTAGVVGNLNPAAGAFGATTDAISTGTLSNSSGVTAFFIGVGTDGPADVITIAAGTGATSVGTGWLLGTATPGARLEYKAAIANAATPALTWTGGYGGHTYKAMGIMFQELAGASTVVNPISGRGGSAAQPLALYRRPAANDDQFLLRASR